MGYIEGTMTSANPAAGLATIIMNELILEGGVFVETYTAGANTIHVMEIPAAISPLSQTWYLCVWHATAGATVVNMFAAEGYVSATKLFTRGTYYSTSSNIPDATTGSRFGSTGQAYSVFQSVAVNVRTTAFLYNFVADGACVAIGTTAQGEMKYVGQMSPSPAIKAGNDSNDGYYPLLCINGLNSATNAMSRLYGGISSTSRQFWQRQAARVVYDGVSRTYYPERQPNIYAVPAGIGPDEGSAVVPEFPSMMGTLYNVIFLRTAGISHGDRFVCNGYTWSIPYGSTAGSGYYLLKVGPA